MIPDRTCRIRRAVLEALRDGYPAGFSADELAIAPQLAMAKPTRDEILTALRDLVTYGFLSYAPGSDREYVHITSDGLAQIHVDGVDRDPRIWGRYAL